MSKSILLREIRKRANRLDSDPDAVGRFAYPIGDNGLGFAVPDGFENGDLASAVWTITDGGIDRDGDMVDPDGIDFTSWKNCGAPVLYGHGQFPVPIGSCIIPNSNPPDLDVWREGDTWKARVYFHNDPTSRLIASKANCLGASIAFLPLRATRRDGSAKAHYGDNAVAPPGWAFSAIDVSELSLTPTPSNNRATRDLAYAKGCPELIRKHVERVCTGGKCFTPMIPRFGPKHGAVNSVLARFPWIKHLERIRQEHSGISSSVWKQTPPKSKTALDRLLDSIDFDIARIDKMLGEFSGPAGGYAVGTQADIPSPDNDPTDRYGKVRKCPCGADLKSHFKFCPVCGSQVKGLETDGAGPTDPTGEAALVDAGQVPPDSTKSEGDPVAYCDQCGAEVPLDWQEQGMEVCEQCGAPLADEDQFKDGAGADADKEEIFNRYGNDDNDGGTYARYLNPRLDDRRVGVSESRAQRR